MSEELHPDEVQPCRHPGQVAELLAVARGAMVNGIREGGLRAADAIIVSLCLGLQQVEAEREPEREAIRVLAGDSHMEELAEAVHQAYCDYYLVNKGEPYWTGGDYSKLDEATKEIDRATVRAVLAKLRALPGMEVPKCYACGEPAVCVGQYDGGPEGEHACGSCCGHGNEDGHCEILPGIEAKP